MYSAVDLLAHLPRIVLSLIFRSLPGQNSVNISVSELISCACASVSLLTRKKHLDFFARTHTQRIIALDFHAVHIKPKVCVKV